MMRTALLIAITFLTPYLFLKDIENLKNTKPKLVLVIAVDQMRADYLTRFRPLYTGGFRWLQQHGAEFTEARYRHANTETGPGHAIILSGRHGSHSGIVANSWFDRYLKTDMNVVDDATQTAVESEGRGASPANLIGFTLGDALKKESPGSRVVGISVKDRAAVLMGGQDADAAYWYDTKNGKFVTSSYYMPRLPSWLEAWNAHPYPDQYAGKVWERSKEEALYTKYAGPDAVEGEFDRVRTTFPHAIEGKPSDRKFYEEFRRVPFIDEMTLKVALEAMKAHDLGSDDATDILAIGFSGTDIIGHTYGPDSQEIMDQMLRLDQYLQTLFKAVDQRAGLANTLIVLTADHGVMPLVEVLKSRGIDARRVPPSELETAVTKALTEKFKDPTGLVEYYTPHFYLREDTIQKRGLKRKDVETAVVQAVRASGLAAAVYTQSDLLGDPPTGDTYFPLVRNSFFAPRSPDVIVVLKEYIYMDDYVGGTGHGTVYDYDRHVALVLAGPTIHAGSYNQPCGPEDIAPTLANLLKLTFPKEDDARVLSEAFTAQ
jgi:predicted AlkP superfamily pyrophosphatase or phosphodiesterase